LPKDIQEWHGGNVYLKTTAGDVLLPIGYASESPAPVNEYLATHPQ
jgi:hypothetical protein